MNFRGTYMPISQPPSHRDKPRLKKSFSFRSFRETIRSHKIASAIVVTAVLAGGGTTAAFATSSGQVCTTSPDNVTICHDGGSATSTDSVMATSTNQSKSTTKVTLANYSATSKTGLNKILNVNTFCDGTKRTQKTHQTFRVMKADSSKKCKFTNRGKTTANKPYYFRDYVGSIDSHPGTISATFYWSHEKVNGKWVWQLRKGNCKNPINQAQTPNTVTKVTMVTQWTVNTKLTVNAASKATISAHAKCTVSNATATADSSAQAQGSATASVTGHGSGSSLAIATANSKADAKKKADALRKSIEQTAILNAQTSVTTTSYVTATAQVKCEQSPVTASPSTTPPVTETPTPTPTITKTSTPIPTPTATSTPTPTVTPTPIRTTEAPKPQKPIVEVHAKNDVDQATIDPVTGNVNDSTASGYFTYTISGSDSATVQVTATHGAIRNVSQSSVSGQGTVTFTYVAPSEVPPGEYDTISVTLKDSAVIDPGTGSTLIRINPVNTDSPPNSVN